MSSGASKASRRVASGGMPFIGEAVLVSIADYQFLEPNPLGHASVEALAPALEMLGFRTHLTSLK